MSERGAAAHRLEGGPIEREVADVLDVKAHEKGLAVQLELASKMPETIN